MIRLWTCSIPASPIIAVLRQSALTDTASSQEFLFSLDILIFFFPQKLKISDYEEILWKIDGN